MRLKRKIPGKIFAVRNVCLLLAVVLAFGAAAFTPAIDGTARAVDFDKACSLTVNPGSGEFSEDLASAGIVKAKSRYPNGSFSEKIDFKY